MFQETTETLSSAEVVGLIALLLTAIGGISALITYYFPKRGSQISLLASTKKITKETEQIELEIESKYAVQVRSWLSDLEEIKEKHDAELDRKNAIIEGLHNQIALLLKSSEEYDFKLVQIHKAVRRLFVNMKVPYWECDKDGKLLFANGSWLNLFGLSLEDAKGEGWLKAIPKEDRNKLLVLWYSKVVDEADGSIEFRVENPVSGEKEHLKSLYVIAYNRQNEIEKIYGVTMELHD